MLPQFEGLFWGTKLGLLHCGTYFSLNIILNVHPAAFEPGWFWNHLTLAAVTPRLKL